MMQYQRDASRHYWLIVLLSCTVNCFGDETEEWTLDFEKKSRIDLLFDEWNSGTTPGAAIGIVRRGKPLYSRAYGIANLDHSAPLRTDSLFYIASASKQFTAAGVAMLAQQGVLDLDADIRTWLTELPDIEPPITVRHLLHHTSGVRDYGTLMALQGRSFNQYFDNVQTVALLGQQRGGNFAPGDRYQYCNSNYVLLAEILKRCSGTTIREFSQEHIFRPLRMERTQWVTDPRQPLRSRVTSYLRSNDSDGWLRFDVNFGGHGDGNLWTSVDDLFRWDANFFDATVGGADLIRRMLTPGKLNDGTQLDYAFGLLRGEHKGHHTVSHGGQLFGYSAEILRFPDRDLTVIVLANTASIDASEMARAIADIVLGLPSASGDHTNEERSHLNQQVASAFAGEFYQASLGRVLTVSFLDQTLTLEGLGAPMPLSLDHENRFRNAAADVAVDFVMKDGIAEELYLKLPTAVESDTARRLKRNRIVNRGLSGRYRSDELMRDWTLRVVGERLEILVGGQTFELSPLDSMHAETDLFDIELRLDGQGRMVGFTVFSDGASGIEFVRDAP
ncbi:MAG: serine hydrolase domain-containing protein [Pirellulaceae bacterium]|nr:beta-lactamase family protein [Planctomycetales bacterium]